MHLSFQISCRFFKDVLLKILFLNFQHPLFFLSLLKLRTFSYTSPLGAGCLNPKNIGWMNSICNSQKQNNSSNPIRIPKFLFLSYSFGIETTNTFIHFRKCPRRKPYPFSDQNSTKTLPDGVAYTCILAYIGEYPPGLEG